MIHDIMPGTEEQLQKEMTTAYVGIDPTGRLTTYRASCKRNDIETFSTGRT